MTSRKLLAYRKRKHRSNTKVRQHNPEYRLLVSRSLKHIYAQIVNTQGEVVLASSDLALDKGTKLEKATQVGKDIAQRAQNKKLTGIVFDRNGYLFHGRVKALCEAAREAGLDI